MNTTPILEAMRADDVPARAAGLWVVRKQTLTMKMCQIDAAANPDKPFTPPGTYTFLERWTEATIFGKWTSTAGEVDKHRRGELVMNDIPSELRKHLDFVMKARGRILVTGLGLGCVVRGLLYRGNCDEIHLVERDASVIELCAAAVRDRRVVIHHADATRWLPEGRFDYAWHDLWADPDKNEPGLQAIHMRLMADLHRRCPNQGAWAMPRKYTKRLPELRLKAKTGFRQRHFKGKLQWK